MKPAAETVSTHAIEIRGLTKSFGENLVLDSVDLVIETGLIVGYVGANGSGKTTTLHILAGLIPDFDGEVLIHGEDVRTDVVKAQGRIGYMPEVPQLYETLTLAETCLFYGRLHGLEDALIEKRAVALLENFALGEYLGQPIGSFSKGMRQKALFTFAVLHDPDVLLLDEPFSGLDAGSSLYLRELLRRFAEQGKTILLSSHALNLVEELSDEIIVLHGGRFVAQGPFSDVAVQLQARSLNALVAQLEDVDPLERSGQVDRVLQAFAE